MRRHSVITMMGCALLAGCGELGATVVELPRAQAVELFYHIPGSADLMDLPLKEGRSAERRVDRTPDGVAWTYLRKGSPVCQLTIHIREESATSSVVWTEVEKVAAYDDNNLCAALDIAGSESVAATIEGRAANRERAENSIAALYE
jgi:hypothetical protein